MTVGSPLKYSQLKRVLLAWGLGEEGDWGDGGEGRDWGSALIIISAGGGLP
jgi:hypothetical protein